MRAKLLWDQYYCILEGQMFKAERNGHFVQREVQQHWFMGLAHNCPVCVADMTGS